MSGDTIKTTGKGTGGQIDSKKGSSRGQMQPSPIQDHLPDHQRVLLYTEEAHPTREASGLHWGQSKHCRFPAGTYALCCQQKQIKVLNVSHAWKVNPSPSWYNEVRLPGSHIQFTPWKMPAHPSFLLEILFKTRSYAHLGFENNSASYSEIQYVQGLIFWTLPHFSLSSPLGGVSTWDSYFVLCSAIPWASFVWRNPRSILQDFSFLSFFSFFN